MRATAASQGYLLADSGGGVIAFGDATTRGGLDGASLAAPIVDGDMTPTGLGYVLVGSDGGVFSFGDAPFLGGLGGTRLAAPIVGIDITPTGRGYILAAADGGVFAFGDAPFRGSMGGVRLNAPIVDIGLTPANDGYRLSATDGGVFAFGNATFAGSMGGRPLNKPITGLVGQKDGPGYALVAADGGFFAFNGFAFRGSLGGITLASTIVDAVPSPTGNGYNLVGSDGGVFAFGDAPYRGSLGGYALPRPIVTILGLANESPEAGDDSYNATEDTALAVGAASGVLANDRDGDGDTLTATLVTGPSKGTLTLNANGSFTYTPNANANGADSFTYRVSDGYGGTDTATARIVVAAVNDLPVAANDAYSTAEDTTLAVTAPGVLANDSDVDGNPLTAVLVAGPSKGTLALNANGSFTYTPNPNANGSDAFTYRANDGTADSNIATVSLMVTAVNDAPVAVDDAYTTNEDTPLTVTAPGVLANDSDVEGSPLTAALVAGPSKGTLTLNPNGSFTYTPSPNANGSDSFTYKANDGTAAGNAATVSLTVNALSDVPVAVNDAYSTNEDIALTVAAPGVLANDSDVDGNSLTAALVTGAAHGTLTLNANGSFTYTPNAGFGGSDSFTYKANDGTFDSNVATVTITVDSVNDRPVAVDDTYSTAEDTPLTVAAPGVLANDTDAEGPLSAVDFGNAVNGTVVGNADGSFTFTPAAEYTGAASFDYTVTDGTLTDTGTVNVTVTPVNDAPVAVNDTYETNEDVTLNEASPGVLVNDYDAEGDPYSAVLAGGPTHGTLTLNPGGSFTYTPDPNFNGTDTFTYKAHDGTTEGNTGTVTITVHAVADSPTATDDGPYQTLEDTPFTLAAPGVLANDSEPDGQAMTAGNASDPAHGAVTLNPNGSFTYTPDLDFTGTDTFTYDVSDGSATDQGLVTINVVPPNARPTADATSASGNEDGGAITVTLTGHDADGHALTFTAGNGANGVVSGPSGTSCDGATPSTCTATVTYTPNANFNGGDSFTYKVNDGTIDSAAAPATITVNPVNDEPSFTKGAGQAVNEDAGAQTVNGWATGISSGPANESGQTVAFTVTNDNNGLFSAAPAVSGTGVLTYTPASDANGSATVSVTAVDNGGTANGGDDTSPAQTFTITVTAVNDAPSFTKGANQSLNEDAGAQSVSNWATAISKGPADESSQSLSFTTANTDNGLFSVQPGVSPTGTLVYTTAPNKYGTATVTVSLSDNGGTDNDGDDTSDSQTFTITVNAVNDAPVAAAKAFDVQANMKRSISGLLTGATDPNDLAGDATWSPTFSVGSITAGAGCVGCTVSNIDMAAGSFDFEPPAGGTGTYTIDYTVVDNGHPAPGATSAPQTITLTVSGPVIWFADASAGNDTTGNGTLTRPFATLAKVATVDAAGHRVFVHPGTYAAGMALTDNEWLVGAGTKAASFDDFMGIAPPSGTAARPAINGTNPTVQSSVTLASGNTVRGLTLTGANALTGTSFGTLTTGAGSSADVVLNSAGQALSLTTGTITGDFVSTTSSGGTDNVFLSAVNTTTATSLGTGALSGAASEGFQVVGGTGTFTYVGTVANATGTTVSISGKTGGTVTFNGAVSDTGGAGVSLSSNTGATIAFNGGVSLTSGASPAFVATGGGTVTVTGSANTLTSTTGTALNVANTTIGTADVTFRSISSNGAARGIVLDNTGAVGNLVVTGNGGTCTGANQSGCSGGTIANTTGGDDASATPIGTGIVLNNTRDVSLTRMWIHDTSNYGIRGTSVTNLAIADAVIGGANGGSTTASGGSPFNDGSARFHNLTGTVRFDRVEVSGGWSSNVEINNTSGTLNATFDTMKVGANGTTEGNDGLQVESMDSATINVSVLNSTFTSSRGDLFQYSGNGSGGGALTFTGNTLTNNHPAIATGGGGVTISAGAAGNFTMNIAGNSLRDALGNAWTIVKSPGAGSITGTFDGNTVGNPAVANSGSVGGAAVKMTHGGTGGMTWAITNNNLHQYNNWGILVQAGAGSEKSGGTVNATVSGNTLSNPGTNAAIDVAFQGITINSGVHPDDTFTTCVDFGPNSVVGSGRNAGGDVRVRQRQQTTLRLPGYSGGTTDTAAVVSFVKGKLGQPSAEVTATASGSGGGFTGTGSSC